MTWLACANGLTAPVVVAQVELSDPAVAVPATRYAQADAGPLMSRARQALVLVRLHGRPIGTILIDAPAGQVDPLSCAQQAWTSLENEITRHLCSDGLPPLLPIATPPDGLMPPCTRGQSVPPAAVTVVVATRERPELLAACLDSLAELDYPDYEVVVVDNDPVTDRTAALVRSRPGVRYVTTARRGLAAAHNCGLAVAEGEIVAFTDDDVLADRNWLAQVAAAMRSDPDVACVTGLIMPAELMTQGWPTAPSEAVKSEGNAAPPPVAW